MSIVHPLKEGQFVTAERPSCPCRNAKIITSTGTIQIELCQLMW